MLPLQDWALNGADRSRVVSISVFVAVLCLCIVIGHLIQESRWVKESFAALLIGCVTGLIILLRSKGASSHILRFDQDLFFIYLVPPIIFNAGFQVKKKQFFHNFLTIMLFGVVGVFISSAIIAAGKTKRGVERSCLMELPTSNILLLQKGQLEVDRFFTSYFNEETYTKKGLQWVNTSESLKDVIKMHYPKITETWLNVASAFSVWDAPSNAENAVPLYLHVPH